MSMFIHAIIVILLALLAMGIRAADSCVLGFGSMCKQTGFLSGKGLSGEIKEVCAWTLSIADKFIHYFSIKVQGCRTAPIQVVSIGTAVGFENIHHIPVIKTIITSGICYKEYIIVGFYHSYCCTWVIFFCFSPWKLASPSLIRTGPKLYVSFTPAARRFFSHKSLCRSINSSIFLYCHD